MTAGTENRREERVTTALPVTSENVMGITRDVSATGVYFETDANLTLGATIEFSVELDTPGGKRVLKCLGQIVRTEALDHRVGAAVKILDSTLMQPH